MSKFPLFALSTSTPDYTNIEFLDVENEDEAREKYQEERDEADSEDNHALFKINGTGSLYLGSEASANGNVECLEDSVWE